ncbi:T9SS type A sorting domain-containing protein [Lewinella sp. LCG006]|uniref:T9SS type A sorting domain-containing protein n=1 Tax=Lewinella sp. LCG006 TaxID=3231911 RepID=UPI00345F5FDC
MLLSKKAWHLLLLLPWTSTVLFAQIDDFFVRDSIEIEQGISGTTNFEPLTRVINESFDANNRPLSTVIYRYLSANEVAPSKRQTFEYDEDGNITFFFLEEWSESEENWLPIKQENSTYENGRLAVLLRRIPVGGELQNYRQWTYQYTPTGFEAEKLLQDWNPATQLWDNVSRKTTAYNAEGRIIQQRLERFVGGEWRNRRQRVWSWDAGQLQPSQTLSQVWSAAEGVWVNDTRKNYSMTANGVWSGSVIQAWNVVTEEWDNDIREVFNIDIDNNTTSYVLEQWDNGWQSDLRSQYNYSTNENTALLQRWNTDNLAHENFLRYRSLFNTDRLPVQRTGMQAWNADAASWQNENYTRRVNYFWRASDPSTTTELADNQCIIPNPYWSGTTISCELSTQDYPLSFEVYNLYGQLLLQKPVNSQSFTAETSSLPGGLYIFKLSDNRRVYQVQKVVVAN